MVSVVLFEEFRCVEKVRQGFFSVLQVWVSLPFDRVSELFVFFLVASVSFDIDNHLDFVFWVVIDNVRWWSSVVVSVFGGFLVW